MEDSLLFLFCFEIFLSGDFMTSIGYGHALSLKIFPIGKITDRLMKVIKQPILSWVFLIGFGWFILLVIIIYSQFEDKCLIIMTKS